MSQELTDLACPFCGLACDDLTLVLDMDRLAEIRGGCPKAKTAFAAIACASPTVQAWVKGQAASLEEALEVAFHLLREAKNPLFGGFATDVMGSRSLLALADRMGAVVDHMNSEAKLKNLKTVQDLGWITTTLGEVKSRADVIVVVGTDVVSRYPRFFERCVAVEESLFMASPEQRHVIFVGDRCPPEGTLPACVQQTHIEIASARLPEAMALLRGIAHGSLPANLKTDLPMEALISLEKTLRLAQYGVVTWVAPDLPWAHAELTIQSITGLVAELNTTTRAAGLPLGGSDGDFSADAVLLWQTGYPYRSSFASGTAHYDPLLFATERLLENGEVDCLLWVASLNPERTSPPKAECPVIALTSAGAEVLKDVDVQITVATPGIDAAGYVYRADKVVSLPLRAVISRGLPGVDRLADHWLKAMGEGAC